MWIKNTSETKIEMQMKYVLCHRTAWDRNQVNGKCIDVWIWKSLV